MLIYVLTYATDMSYTSKFSLGVSMNFCRQCISVSHRYSILTQLLRLMMGYNKKITIRTTESNICVCVYIYMVSTTIFSNFSLLSACHWLSIVV